jgi:hypothetical protein
MKVDLKEFCSVEKTDGRMVWLMEMPRGNSMVLLKVLNLEYSLELNSD